MLKAREKSLLQTGHCLGLGTTEFNLGSASQQLGDRGQVPKPPCVLVGMVTHGWDVNLDLI